MRVQPHDTNADLHAHSTFSDGTLSPRALVERAHARGVEMFALTDHDEVRGLPAAAAAARELGLRFVPGVEVSVTFAGHTVHIVGLGVDAADAALQAGLDQVRSGRTRRAREMADGLAAAGIADAYEGALAYVGNPDLISRTHFARYLVQIGVCADTREVFGRFLIEGKPGYVPHRWASLAQAVQWITGAGGVAVIAHPGRYKLTPTELWALFSEFREAGGVAVEVATSNHGADDVRRFAQMAQEFGLEASRGSDFHGPNESHAELGVVAALPYALTPVWHRFC
jgi:3',5'-nucleoside bisphosphate phosphatase